MDLIPNSILGSISCNAANRKDREATETMANIKPFIRIQMRISNSGIDPWL